MKQIVLIFSLIIAFCSGVFADANMQKKANDLYAKGDYSAAIVEYESMLKNEGVAPELYYNLGNAYYKSGEVAKTILNYERALRLKPTYDLAKVNLEMAQLKVVDNVVQIPPFFIKRWIDVFIKFLSSNQWLFISIVLLVLALGFGLLFIFGYSVSNRKMSFYVALILIILTVVTGIFSAIRKDQMESHNDAIIMSSLVVVKSSPDKSGTDLFTLHEGTKVAVKSELLNWTEIILGNGNVGWVENIHVEKI